MVATCGEQWRPALRAHEVAERSTAGSGWRSTTLHNMIRLQHWDDQPPRDALQKCKTKLEPVDLRQTRLARKHKSQMQAESRSVFFAYFEV
eukprot:7350164-Prymnesium_polylepis.1